MSRSIPVINLAESFPDYSISWDDDARGRTSRTDPTYMQINTICGLIYPYDTQQLAVQVDNEPRIVKRMKKMNCCKLIQDGDDETTFLVHVKDFDAVKSLVHPHCNRVYRQ